MLRPLMQQGVGQLEALFASSRADLKVLKQLEHELQYRQVPRAVALLAEVRAAMCGATSAPPLIAAPTRPPTLIPAPPPQQPTLWKRPPVPPPVTVAPPVVQPRPAALVTKALEAPAAAKPSPPAMPAMPLEDAYKLLKATTGSTWESIEQTRRQLVQQSHPGRLKSMSAERRAQALAEAKRVNAAYVVLSQARFTGS